MFGRKRQGRQAPDTGVRVHESGYIMRTGECMVLGQEATSPEGGGWLLATDMSLFFIHHSRGIYLNLDHHMIMSLADEKGRITVRWLEGDQPFGFQMRLREGFYSSGQAADMLNARFQYSEAGFEHAVLADSDVREARKDRLGRAERRLASIRNAINDLEGREGLSRAEKDDLGRFRFLEVRDAWNKKCIESMPFVRSARIPPHVPLAAVWNDCYFDGERRLFVTFRRFCGGLGPKTLGNQKKLNPGGEGIVFPAGEVDFCHGYPSIGQKAEDGDWTSSLLCTMAEEMVTGGLVLALMGTCASWEDKEEAHMGRVWYEAEAPRWIGGSFFKLTDAEREKAFRYTPWLKATNDSGVPWIKPHRIIPDADQPESS